MEYSEKTSKLSQQHIKLFWSLKDRRDHADSAVEPILPDGCFEIVFDLADRFVRVFDNGTSRLQPRTIIAGQISSRILVAPSGNTDLFGVRFHPFSATPFLGLSAADFTDRIIDAADVLGKDETLIFEQLSETPDLDARIAIFEQFLFSRIDQRRSHAAEIDHAISEIIRTDGKTNIAELAGRLAWSERRLERRFNEFVGISPKLFSRVTRFQSMLKRLQTHGTANLFDHIFDAGYYDQSHMIREFRQFSGTTPSSFLNNEHRISEYFAGSGSVSDFYNT